MISVYLLLDSIQAPMKLSFYNIYIPHGGFTIIYNAYSDKFIGISNHVAAYLKAKDFEVKNFEVLYPSVYGKLKSLGMLMCDDIDELGSIKQKYVEAKYDNRKLYFMVYPTQDCNLKCWYCYESHKIGTKMTHDVLLSILKFIDNEIKNNTFDAIHLALFGGEPLLNFTKVAYPLTRAIKDKCENSGKAFTSFFVTNASLMTDAIIEKMSELNPYFQITLDGDKSKHDSVRIWKNNSKGTYQQIIHAVHMICERISTPENVDDPLVTLRINYDNETLRNVDYILRDLKDVDRHKVRIHLERVWQTRNNIDKAQQRLLLSALGKFVNEGFVVSHGVFRRKSIACPSDSMSFFIVNYDGSIHKCNGRTLGEQTQEGLLDADGVIRWDEKRRNFRRNLITFDNPACLSCKILPLCMGPCSQKFLETGKFTREICSKNSIDFSIEEYLKFQFEMRYYMEKINH